MGGWGEKDKFDLLRVGGGGLGEFTATFKPSFSQMKIKIFVMGHQLSDVNFHVMLQLNDPILNQLTLKIANRVTVTLGCNFYPLFLYHNQLFASHPAACCKARP